MAEAFSHTSGESLTSHNKTQLSHHFKWDGSAGKLLPQFLYYAGFVLLFSYKKLFKLKYRAMVISLSQKLRLQSTLNI